jgi:muconolactone delta-isomerase
MRVAVIYRPRQAPPAEQMGSLFQAMGSWVERYGNRLESVNFFAGGGGMGIIDIDDAAELQRILAQHPFTPYADVEVHPTVDAQTALRNLQEAFSTQS